MKALNSADKADQAISSKEKVIDSTESMAQAVMVALPNNNRAITETPPYCTNSSAPTPREIASGKIKMAQPTREAMDKFSGDKFLLQADGTLKCPANKILKPGERRTHAHLLRIVYQANLQDCRNCPIAPSCRIDTNASKGRRVSMLIPLSITEPSTDQQKLTALSRVAIDNSSPNLPLGTEPVYWLDLPASSLRRSLSDLLSTQQIEISLPTLAISTIIVALSRDQRAHRRLSWAQRFNLNAAPRYSAPWRFHIYGLPHKLSAFLSSISSLAA